MSIVRKLACRPFVTTHCALKFTSLSPGIQTRVLDAIRQGFISSDRGESAMIHVAAAKHFQIPEISVPRRGRMNNVLTIKWSGIKYRPQTLLDIIDKEFWPAELAAAKILYGGKQQKDFPQLLDRDGYAIPGGYMAIKPIKTVHSSGAQYSFKSTRPPWADIIRRAREAAPQWGTNHARALDCIARGDFTMTFQQNAIT